MVVVFQKERFVSTESSPHSFTHNLQHFPLDVSEVQLLYHFSGNAHCSTGFWVRRASVELLVKEVAKLLTLRLCPWSLGRDARKPADVRSNS